MKVKELIEELQKFNPNENVLIRSNDKLVHVVDVGGMFWDALDGSRRSGYRPILRDAKPKEPNDKLKQLLKDIQ